MYLIFAIAGISVLKFTLNFFRLIGTLFIFHIFKKQPSNLSLYCPFATPLFNSAGTQKIIISTIRTNGITQATKDYISNSLHRKDSYHALEIIFQKTIGVYMFRMLQSINPFYWIFLPKNILEHFEIEIPDIAKAIINLLYWLIGVIAAYCLEKYLDLYFQDFFPYIHDMLK